MALNLAKAVLDCLKARPEEKLTARQIAEWIFTTYPAECLEKKSNSQGSYIKTDSDLVQQLVAEIGSRRPSLQKRHSELKTTEGRPRKYYYTEKSDIAEVAAAEGGAATDATGADSKTIGEHALYPLLSLYLWEEFGVYSKRIDEKRSSNKRGPNGNRWLYPDVVGMEDLGADWHQEVRDCVNQYSDKCYRDSTVDCEALMVKRNAPRWIRSLIYSATSRGKTWPQPDCEMRFLMAMNSHGGTRLQHTFFHGKKQALRCAELRFAGSK